ncbi:MAG: coenzyme F420-0:L-glutamate ligase/coenzyme F420-1:gamma-L-glutamate ligase [Verrucomicrobiales bacterium]|jgi:coenzyme F420-0:L-glutamate ligase/coenzyme F420-1:gamma-L-glutamate ligase
MSPNKMSPNKQPGAEIPDSLVIFPVTGIGEIVPGDDLAGMLADAADLRDLDVLVVTQKVVSKAEGRMVEIDRDDPSGHKTIVEDESVRILRRRGDLIISETTHGFICANAGVDLSNVQEGYAVLLPVDSDRSARRIRDVVRAKLGIEIGVIISDTFGRPWRSGVTDVAIGSAGIGPILDLRGTNDALGRELQVTEVAVVDELAAAADLVMGKSTGYPAAIVRGIPAHWFRSGTVLDEIVRDPKDDLFR